VTAVTVDRLSDAAVDTALVRVTGGRPLSGRIPVQGSKNIALHLYAASLLADAPVTLSAAPDIIDTQVCAQILRHIGAQVEVTGGRFAVIPPRDLWPVVHAELGRRVRTTVVLAAAVLARTGQVAFPWPGGDAFCPRLIDRHVAAMRAAGAEVVADGTGMRARCGPRGVEAFTVDVDTPYGPSLGATVTAMLLGARATGASLITHPSIEPEVTETARFLSERGVRIHFDDQGLHVAGSDWIDGGGFAVAGDRIEAATMVMTAAATGGRVHLDNITAAGFPSGLLRVLTAAGIGLSDAPDGGVQSQSRGPLTAVEAATGPHPGLPTDTAPQLAALLTQADGTSLLGERVYPRRDSHAAGLRSFGADITTTGAVIRIRGPVRLHGADVEASDIRAVTALLIAALAAEGTSTIRGLYHLRRGYGHLLSNLATLGADITTVPGGPDARPVHRR
jgi:UDP-N-acetylglucosamine 1-carboxyvinyltransferase